MKLAGFLLLVAGWMIVLAAPALLFSTAPRARTVFILAGICVEVLGLVIVGRSHAASRGDRA
jgi:predicted membrane channel-forming protein YqfA (hemolysin III family)